MLSNLLNYGNTTGPITSAQNISLDTLGNLGTPYDINSWSTPAFSLGAGEGTDWGGLLKDYGGLALGGAQALGNLFMGMKQYGLAKDIFNENKAQFSQNYAAQRGLTNARLEDRQNARLAANGGTGYRSVGDYMATYGVK